MAGTLLQVPACASVALPLSMSYLAPGAGGASRDAAISAACCQIPSRCAFPAKSGPDARCDVVNHAIQLLDEPLLSFA